MEIVPIAKSAANPVAGYVFDNCKDWVSCVLTYKENVKKVQELRKKLEERHKDLQDRVADCTRKGQQVAREVHLWLEQMDRLLQSKNTDDDNGWEDMLKDEMARKEAEQCCLGFCSWNPKYRHHLSRIAAEKAQEIGKILQESEGYSSSLTVGTPPPSMENLSTHFWEGLTSRVELLNKIMEKLNINDQEAIVIGIHGMGGAGLFQHVNSLVEASNQAYEWAKDLLSSSLFMDADFEKGEVKIHDEIRAALISFALEGKYVFNVGVIPRWLKTESYEKFTAISIPADDSVDYLSGRNLPNLQLLHLTYTSRSKLHDCYFLSMMNIKVLQLSSCELETLPPSIGCLKNLETLLLEICKLDNVIEICKLVKLQVLSFYRSSITRLPEEIGNLVELKVLDMTQCYRLSEIPSGTIKNLTQLEGLYMKDSFSNWEIEGSMVSLSELKHLSYLCVLEIDVASTEQLLDDIFLPSNLSSFKIEIVGSMEKRVELSPILKRLVSNKALQLEKYTFSRKLEVVGVSRNTIIEKDMKPLFKTTESLCIGGVNDLENIMPCLLRNKNGSKDCKSTKDLGDSDVFLDLKRLVLFNLPHLKHICYKEPSVSLFPNLQEVMLSRLYSLQPYGLPIQVTERLKVLIVSECENLKYIFWTDGNRRLEPVKFSRLSRLKLKGVGEMLGLFNNRNKSNAKSCKALFTNQMKFPALLELKVTGFNKGRALCNVKGEEFNQIFPQLQSIKLKECSMLSHVWSKKILKGSLSFGKLKHLLISECPKLKNVLYPSVANALLELEELNIFTCSLLEQVILTERDVDGGNPTKIIRFPKLTVLSLDNLDSLRCFYKGNSTVEFQALKRLLLQDFNKAENFVEELGAKEDGVQTKKVLFNKKTILPSLEILYLDKLPSIQELWDLNTFTRFPTLESISLWYMNLKHVWSKQPRGSIIFTKLKHIGIYHCELIESLFPLSPSSIGTTLETTSFPRLATLRLNSLKKFRCLLRGKQKLELPALRELYLNDLPSMNTFFEIEKEKTSEGKDHRTENVMQGDDNMTTLLFNREVSLPSLENLDLLHLNIVGVFDIQSSDDMISTRFPKLEILSLWDIPKLKYVCLQSLDQQSQSPVSKVICFSKLEKISLRDLDSLQCFIRGNSSIKFQKLKILKVQSLPMIKILYKIERYCCEIREDTDTEDKSTDEELTEESYGEETTTRLEEGELNDISTEEHDNFVENECFKASGELFKGGSDNFPCLKILNIRDMAELESILEMDLKDNAAVTICSVSHPVGSTTLLPALIELELSELPKLKNVPWQMLSNLRSLVIRNCFTGAKSLITPTYILGLPEEDEENIHEIVFPKLKYITLEEMSSLRTFSGAGYATRFPSLESIEVRGLPMIKILFKFQRSCSETRKESDTKDKPTDEEFMEDELDGEQTTTRVEEEEPDDIISAAELDNVVEDVSFKVHGELFKGGTDDFSSLGKLSIENMSELESIWEINKKEDTAVTISSVSHPIGSPTLFPL